MVAGVAGAQRAADHPMLDRNSTMRTSQYMYDFYAVASASERRQACSRCCNRSLSAGARRSKYDDHLRAGKSPQKREIPSKSMCDLLLQSRPLQYMGNFQTSSQEPAASWQLHPRPGTPCSIKNMNKSRRQRSIHKSLSHRFHTSCAAFSATYFHSHVPSIATSCAHLLALSARHCKLASRSRNWRK